MKKRDILIMILLLLLCIFSVQAASAADVDLNDTGNTLSTEDISTYSLPDSNAILRSDNNVGSFSDLHGNLSGQSDVTLENNFTWTSSEDSGITTGIEIDHDMTIRGKAGYDIVIDAKQHRVFNIISGAHVTLEGITFINGKDSSSSINGGSILSNGDLTIYNCTFIDNTVDYGEGGAIYTTGKAEITKSTFKFNKATKSEKNGGAVHIGAHSIISNSTFINNTATGAGSGPAENKGGGAVFAADYLTVKNHSHFINNTITGSSSDGGAISAGIGVVISNSTFENCKATYRGGAIRMLKEAVVSDCNFTANDGGTYGGAISANVDLEVYNSRFVDNTVSYSKSAGGAINIRSDASIKLISNCTFIRNTAEAGGAIKTRGGMTITGSRFINNSADYGGAIAGAEKDQKTNNLVNLTNCNFTGNHATGTGDGNGGGAIYSGNTYLYDSTFTDNTAVVNGGAFCVGNTIGNGYLTINNTNFTSNVASTGSGGAINALTTTITYSNFVGNNATVGGGAINARTITVNNTNFTDNRATSTGGAIHSGEGAATIDNSSFTNNKATGTNGDGGALYITGDYSKLSDLTFNSNSAKRNGGAIYWTSGSGNILRSNFTKSKAHNGGAIYITGASTNILYSNFTDNTADVSGGAVYNLGDNNHIDYSVFNDNIAKGIGTTVGGGAIYSRGLNTMITSNFTNNNATGGSGGAIYTGSGNSSVEILNPPYITFSNFTSNHAAQEGGAIFAGFIDSQMYSSTFINNSASRGGAVSMVCNDELLKDSLFINNTATDKGGSIYFQKITFSEVRNSVFINSSALDGGAIYNKGGSGASVFINNDTFINNTAVYNGGAVYYVVDEGKSEEGVSLTRIYRDYDNFDGEGDISAGRTTVTFKNAKGKSYGESISHSLFVNNTDYPINMTVDAYGGTAIVSLTDPKGIDKNSLIIFMNITNKTGDVDNFTIDSSNYDDGHWNEQFDVFYNSFDLEREHNYTAIITFYDSNHLAKVINSTFTTTSQTDGAFQILQDLIKEALNKTRNSIELTRPYVYDNLDIKNQTGCINITSPFTIYGNGWSISAQGFCRIFNITAANVTLVDLVLTKGNASGRHGDASEYGGAIYWSGVNGTLNNVNITSSYAGENGGGIYFNVTATNATVYQCTFIDNIAEGNGGAIDCNATRMYLTETTFISNHGVYGAALCREENATAGYGIYNTFIRNNATIGGAALGWIKAKEISITNYTFIENTAGVSGGAIFVDEYSTSCTVINCTFEGNYIYDQTSGHGGAIEWYADKGIVINSTFTRNYAYDGGAIYANNQSEEIVINNSHFNYNYAYSYGGAISLEASKVTINHTTFKDNHAVNGGGAVFVNGTAASNNVSYSVFESNWVSEGNGGGIDWLASAGNIIYSNFTNNSAVYGGGIYLSGNSNNSVIDHVIFKGNNATKNGGAIDWNAQNGHLLNNQFISNEAEYGAALCREIGATGGSGRNNIFTLNHARISGPALAWMGSDNITIVNYNFTYNTAVVSGGAIYVSNISNNCSVIDCNFIGNRIYEYNEDSYGGAIDWRGADGKIINSNFTKNHAFNGGAVFVGTDHGITNITDSAFIENSAHENGGAISLNASSVHLNRTIFRYNTALSGGAVYVGEKGDSNYIYNSIFDNNKAIKDEDHLIVSGQEAHGGAINWLSAAGHILYSNFTNNYADYGGGIYLNGKSNNTVMDHLIFKGNNATKNGGALDWNAQNGQLFNCSFISNYAGEFGAALCREAEATGGSGIDNSFEYNHAGIAGAALAWMGSVGITITNYTFNYNTANKYGAAIYVAQDSHNCSIIDSRFLGNEIINETGGMGGAVYTVAQNTTVHNTNFTLNKARDGGAIYVGGSGGSTNITDSNFTRNIAVEEGGAIYLSSSNAVINRTAFSYNTAHDGGAIYAGGTGEVNQVYLSSFDNNRAENGFGGAINWVAAAGHIYYTNFTNNYAKYGGGIHFNGNSNGSKVIHVIFENNTATENGGAMESNASGVELTYSTFISNHAKYGAALCRESGATNGSGHDNRFERNHAYISGAALAWMNVSNIRIINYTFINNTADVSGAAIYVSDGSDNCKVYNCYFEENYVTNAIRGRGGAIDWIGNNGEVKNTTFISCVAVEGGAIYVGENSRNMTIFNTSFESCKATGGNGGALELLGDEVTITLSNFTSCFSLKSGGAITPIGSDNLTVTSSRFISCVSFDFGGAIAGIYSNDANISDSYFKFNHAAGHTTPEHDIYGEGGAISWSNSRNLTVSNSTFVSNNAYLSGGSISADNCNDSYVYDIKTYNETAEFNGGSFSWSNSRNVTIENILCNDSGANYKGGSIYLGNVDNVTVKNAFLNSTWASWGQGGGIYVTGNSTLINITLRDGHALDHVGNGIYFASGNSSLINSTFTETINVIYIAEGPTGRNNTVYLINNTIRGENPNRNITHIDNETIQYYDYSIWNEGVLYLDGNDFDYIIFNNGTIMTHTITYMLGGKTYNTTWNTNFTFYADIYDDTGNNNTIISVCTLDTFNDHPGYENETYFMPCNQLPLVTYLQGKFVLGAIDPGLKDNDVVSGTLNNKMPTELVITHSDLTLEVVNFTATITTPVDSNYTIKDDNILFVIHDESGKLPDVILNGTILDCLNVWNTASANISQSHMHVGTYTVTATYPGDEFHHNATTSMLLLLESHPIELVINAADIYYGQTLVCNITSNATSTENGRIRISINGKEVASHIQLAKNGTNITNITYDMYKDIITVPGEYTLSVEFENGTYYQRTTNFTAVEVKKLNATIDANATTPIVWGDPEIINVTIGKNETVDKDVTGFVKLIVDGEDYIEEIKEGKVQFKIYGLKVGTYSDIRIEYMGNDYYNSNSTKVTFIVNKKNITDIFDVQVDNITYGQNATVRVLVPTDAGGNVTIYVDNRPGVNVTVVNGIARLENITGLAGGEHVVNVTYNGDEKYNVDYLNGTKFKVNQKSWKVNVTDVKYMPYGQTTTINVTNIPSDLLSNTITIRIDNVDYVREIVNGKATLRLNNLSAGSHSGLVVYDGDDNYGPISQVFRPSIPKAEPTIRVTQNGTNLTVTVTSDVGNVTGNVTFKVNNVEHTINLTKGNATLIGELKIGDNYVIVTYNGNANYTTAQIADVYNVARLNTTISVNTTNITFGENEIINVTVNVNATGFIAVRIGTQIYVSYINQGVARFNITGLAADVYDNVVVTYYPDTTDFNRNSTVTSFTVNRTKDYKFDVIVDNIEYGQNATVRVILPTDAGGNVTIYVDNRTGVIVNVTNGEAVLENISGLAGGKHVVNVTYNGDSSFAVNYNNDTEFMVNPNTSWDMTIDGDYKPYGEYSTFTVTTKPYNLTYDTLTIVIDGISYHVSIVNGVATLSLNNLSAGSHSASVTYSGDANYTGKTKKFFPSIPQATPTVLLDKDASGNIVATVSGNNATGIVTFILDGYEYPIELTSERTATLTKNHLKVGNNGVVAIYEGDNNYTDARDVKNFTVDKQATAIEVNVGDKEVDEDVVITVSNLPSGATGYVVVEVKGVANYTINLTAGKNSVTVKGLPAGTYNVNATYLGDGNYLSSYDDSESFTVSKLDAKNIDVQAGSVDYGNPAVIVVTVPSADMTGTITLTLNDTAGTRITLPIYENKVTWNVAGLAAGKYTVHATYNGNYKYNINDTLSKTFEVRKVAASLTIDEAFTDTLNKATIYVHINETATGSITITVKDKDYTKDYTKEISSGVATFTIDVLPAGDYNISAVYNPGEDKNYSGGSDKLDYGLHVTKVDNYTITVTGMNITVHDDEIITVTVSADVTSVSIWVDGAKFTNDSFTGRVAKFNVTGLKLNAGVHYVNATVDDVEYASKVVNNTFIISPINTTLHIDVHDVVIWNKEYINVTIQGAGGNVITDASGKINITLNGVDNPVSIDSGVARFNTADLVVGENIVCAYYAGEINYVGNHSIATFTVTQRTPKANVTATNVTVDTPTTITVTIPANATGFVIITGNFTDKQIYLGQDNFTNEGVATINVGDLAAGKYSVHIKYYGLDTDPYSTVENDTTFKVSKLAATGIVVDAHDTEYGKDALIEVTVPEDDMTGTITIALNDTAGTHITLPIYNKQVAWNVTGLAGGKYTATATYSGNYKYYDTGSWTDTFEVRKVVASLTIDDSFTDALTPAEITVHINKTATGTITITVKDKPYTQPITDGVATFTIDVLPAGDYDISAVYNAGDDKNYSGGSGALPNGLHVSKVADYVITVTGMNITVHDDEIITVTVPTGVNSVSIWVDGNKRTNSSFKTLTPGVAKFNVTDLKLDAGVHYINATVDDVAYPSKVANNVFIVSPINTTLHIDVHAVDVWNKEYINVTIKDANGNVITDASGKVNITLNGVAHPVTIAGGVARFNTDVLVVGENIVCAYYAGEINYVGNHSIATFTVNQRTPKANVTATNVSVGTPTTIEVTIPANATGFVIITGNFTDKQIYLGHENFTGGVATVDISDLAEGKYSVHIKYYGLDTDPYSIQVNDTTFKVSKETPAGIVVDAHDTDYGKAALIEVTVPSDDMTGTITITLNDIAGTHITLPIYENKVAWNVAGLAGGKYTATATYSGNYKYYDTGSWTGTFEVRKVAPSLTIDDAFTDAITGAEIFVHINKTATGSITIIVEGKPYTQPIKDGVATFTIDVLPVGDYDISAFYNPGEDKNYTGGFNTNSKGLHVTKVADYNIAVTGMNITVHDDEIITVSVPDGVTSVSIWVDGNKRTNSSFTGGIAKFNVTDLKLDAGVHYVNATVNDVAYASKVVNNTFVISPIDTTLYIDVHTVDIWDKEYINVTIKDASGNVVTDASGNVIITLNGVDNPVSISEGVARFSTDNLVVGENIVCAYYAGEINYVGNHSIATFTVTQRTPKANVTATNVTVDTPTAITVTIPANATGYVIITGNFTDNEIYVENSRFSSGVATVDVSGLAEGTYSVHIKYYGLDNDNYTTVENDTTFKVSKLSSKVTVEVDNITYGDNAAVNVTVTIGAASGNVTITIGDEYNKTVGVTDGVISVIVPGLTAGDKTVNVTYNGNYKYLPSSNSTEFTVSGADVSMIVVAQNVTYGENETITVYVNAEGNVTFRIDNNDYGTVNITDGKAVLNVPLEAGNHTVEAIYNGAPGFNSTSLKANFTVEKADPIMSIDVQNIIFGGVEHIRVHVNAEGDVTIRVIGTGIVETVSLENGEKDIILRAGPSDSYEGNATLNIYNIRGGRYPVEVTYNGNGNYNKLTASTEFEVYKADTSMYIEAEPYIDAGEDQTINITLSSVKATGWVYVYLAGRVSPRPVFDGLANYTTPLLESGKYQYVIIYEGDENFNPYIARGTFEVGDAPSLKDVSIDLDVEPYLYAGETQVINITMSDSEATGRVTIILDNNNYTRILDNGVANFTTPVLPGGNYTVVVIYEGNYMFNSNWTYDSFEVERVNPSRSNVSIGLEINPHVPAGETQVINITMSDSAATGKVTISVDGEKYTENLTNGAANFTIPALSSGNHTVVVIYEGDENFNGNWTYATFEVDKIPSSVSVDVTHNPTGENQTITVTADKDDATGYAIVDVDGTKYAVELNKGTGSITISGLTAGDHTINVTYLGDENYAPSSDETTLSLSKLPSGVEVNVENITVGDKAVIEITVPENATGNATVNVDGTDYTVSVAGGKGTLVLSDLGVSEHKVTVTYNGDEIYDSSSDSATFEVAKQDGDDVVKVTDQGDGTVVVEVPEGTTGTVTVEVDGENYTGEIVGGKAVINLENATPGVHEAKVTVPGNENRTETVIDTTVSIPKEDTPLDVIVDGDTIVVNVPEGASGNITVEVDGKTYTQPINGTIAKFTIDDLSAGDKTAVVKYAGDDNYAANSTSVDFTVPEVDSDMNVTVEGGDVGEDVTVTVELPEDATGQVLIDIDGVGYYANVTDGVAKLVIPNVLGGEHEVSVTYTGDDKYASDSYSGSFDMNKVDSSVTVSAEDITVGDKAVIEITVPEDATGNVTVNVGGTDYTAYVANGKATLVLSDLGVGEHEVTVTYNGDGKYNSSTGSATFDVAKQDGDDVVKVTDQGDGTVVVEVPEGTTGTVTVEVDGENYTGEIVDGKAVIKLENATPGVHDMKVTVPGNENRTETVIDTTVNIPKEDTPLDVSVDGDTIVVNVPEGAFGNITVEVDGKTYTQPINGTEAKFTIDGLSAGDKTAVVKYAGDDNYAANSTSVDFTVPEADPDMKVTVEGGDVGENVTITVELPDDATGQVLIDIDGVGYYANVTDGVAKLEIPNVLGGEHDVKVTYAGDDKYASDSYSGSFDMNKVDSSVTVGADDITVGDKAVIEITVPEDATGNVTITVDGTDYTVDVAGGKATLVLSDLGVGEHEVTVTYNGDGKYNPSSGSATFEVAKQDGNDVVKVTDQGDGTIVVEVLEGTTGTVTVEVDGENYTGEIVDGKAVIKLENATPGVHDMKVTVPGNENRTETVTDTTVSIPKEETQLDITVDDIEVGDDEGIVVKVPEDATGNITIEIDGKSYTRPVSGGKAVFAIEGLTAGNKTATIRYSGDEKYASSIETAIFNVAKADATIEATIDDSQVGENVIVDVVLPDDATGVVLIDIGGVGYYANVTDGVAHVEIPRIPSGYYDDVTITYTGDDKYSSSTTETSFNMSKVESFVIPNAINITYGENEVITLSVPKDATGNVTLTINGVEYTLSSNGELLGENSNPNTYIVAVSGGNGVITISGLPEGEYIVSATYNGDDKYFAVSNSTKFRVAKSKVTIDVIDQGNGTVLAILPSDATGNVSVELGNETYIATVKDGKAWIDLDGATPGTHDITVTYSGDRQYNSKTEQSSVVIPKYDSPISVDVSDIYVGDTLNVEITLPDDATGTVTVEIDGEEYTATAEGGKVIVPISGLTAGDKSLIVRYSGDDNYLSNLTTAKFSVSKVIPTIEAKSKDTSAGNDELITVDVPKDATGRVLVNIDGIGYYGDIINGKAKVFIPNLPAGSYEATVMYEGDDKYLPSESVTTSFNITKVEAPMSAYGTSVEVGDNETITVYLPEDATGTVTLKLNGKTYTTGVKDGKAVFIIPDLPAGSYEANVTYGGDDKYLPGESVTSFNITKVHAPMSADGCSIEVGDDATITVHLPEDATGTVTLIVDGKTYVADVKNGKAVFVIPDLAPGDHKIVAIYSGDDKYDGNMTESDIEVFNNETPENRTPYDRHVEAAVGLSRYETSNPILILLMALIAIASINVRRFKK